ncbi:preprotein translocase subunit SecG [Sphingomicrobium lutaoense]|uniref:Protein-export membrane protein SecG n=1 Tax=Sphingomicrobium lutaoense TaxID=515949 RepID=A0A839YUC2_9SPHN|nr:preprotein translocase subunit SecG [Sphingomicrobium lutaoense]MBB3763851.1 preprotein translocase subunit SecG [Sphingomicrobium lutaoense]
MFTFLLILQALVAVALVSVILMQRSEGGGLGVGGNSSGFMSARGAADFLTRATAVLATIFVLLAIALAAVAGTTDRGGEIDTSLVNDLAPSAPIAPIDSAPATAPADAAGDDAAPITE